MRQQFVIRIPRAPAPVDDGGTGGGCELAGPYLAQAIVDSPEAGDLMLVYAIYGLADSDAVDWTLDATETDYVIGNNQSHVFVTVYRGGPGGTVAASVNGEPLGTAPFGAVS